MASRSVGRPSSKFTGGTFTISNLGVHGIGHFTPLISPPQAAFLAVGAATEEAVVRAGQACPSITESSTARRTPHSCATCKAVAEAPARIVV